MKKTKKKRKKKNLKKRLSVFPTCFVKIHLIFLYFLYALDIYVSRNGNNLKLKVKSEFSLSIGLIKYGLNAIIIHSTTVLWDT